MCQTDVPPNNTRSHCNENHCTLSSGRSLLNELFLTSNTDGKERSKANDSSERDNAFTRTTVVNFPDRAMQLETNGCASVRHLRERYFTQPFRAGGAWFRRCGDQLLPLDSKTRRDLNRRHATRLSNVRH